MKTIYQKKLCGGLGNQLFMIFHTISLALDSGYDFHFMPNQVFIANDTRAKRGDVTLIFENIARNFKDKVSKTLANKNNYEVLKVKGTYNQTLKYERFEEIVNMSGFRDYQLSIKNKYESKFNPNFKYVSIHFRYSDYRNVNCHYLIKKKYYISCLDLLQKSEDITKLKFFIFFERYEPEVMEIISQLKETFDINYEIIDPKISPDETLTLQSLCNYNIIANSTFSLWSALLNNNVDKKVFCPNHCKNTHNSIYNHYKFKKVSIH